MHDGLGKKLPPLDTWPHLRLTHTQESWSYKIARDVRAVVEGGPHGYGAVLTGIPNYGDSLYVTADGLGAESKAVRHKTPEEAFKALVAGYAKLGASTSVSAKVIATLVGGTAVCATSAKLSPYATARERLEFHRASALKSLQTLEKFVKAYGKSDKADKDYGYAGTMGRIAHELEGALEGLNTEAVASVHAALETPVLPGLERFKHVPARGGNSETFTYVDANRKATYVIRKWSPESRWYVVDVRIGHAIERMVDTALRFSDGHPEQFATPEAAHRGLLTAFDRYWAPPRVHAAKKPATRELRQRVVGDMRTALELPVIFSGSLAAIEKFAKKNGLKFMKDSSLFGGYYIHSNGTTFEVT